MEKFEAGEMLRKKEAIEAYKKTIKNNPDDSMKNKLELVDKQEEFISMVGSKKKKVSLSELKEIHDKFSKKDRLDRTM